MKQKVSIIVPVYNASDYLKRCMKSLLEQTYEKIEIILVDDGSTDDTGSLCDAYGEEYERVKVFHMECEGVSAARNRGIQEARGDYLMFVDADDCPAKDMTEYLVRCIEQSGSDVAGCGFRIFHTEAEAEAIRNSSYETGRYENNRKTGENAVQENVGGKEQDAAVEILTGEEFVEKGILNSDTRCWSKLYRRESLGEVRFDTAFTIGEDMLFLLKLAEEGKSFCRCSYQGYGYFVNDRGAMRSSFKDSYMDQITCWQQALTQIEKKMPKYKNRAEAILLISVMLVVGKLSMLPKKEQKEKKAFLGTCLTLVKQYGKNTETFQTLDGGYRLKIKIFRCMPHLYLKLYGELQRRKAKR